MRQSEFWNLIRHVFGDAYASSLARDLHLNRLDSRTAAVALEDGVDPRDVWHALCEQMDVPEQDRDGGDGTRLVPPPRG